MRGRQFSMAPVRGSEKPREAIASRTMPRTWRVRSFVLSEGVTLEANKTARLSLTRGRRSHARCRLWTVAAYLPGDACGFVWLGCRISLWHRRASVLTEEWNLRRKRRSIEPPKALLVDAVVGRSSGPSHGITFLHDFELLRWTDRGTSLCSAAPNKLDWSSHPQRQPHRACHSYPAAFCCIRIHCHGAHFRQPGVFQHRHGAGWSISHLLCHG